MTPEMFNMIYLGDSQGDCENKMCLFIKTAVKVWVKIAGQWRRALAHTKVAGVWKSALVGVKENGSWT
jgi:hypothetical protein